MRLEFAPALGVVVSELLETVLYASIAGIGIAVIFSAALFGATKSIDYASEDRRLAAVIAGALGGLALAACLAGVAFGIYIMAAG